MNPDSLDSLTSAYGQLITTRLHVMTWNLWGRFGPWETRGPAIATTLSRVDPDIACLQEVWSDDESGRNQAAELATTLGFDHVYATRSDGPIHSGNAILSRWPILRSEWRPLPTEDEPDERRTVVFAEVDGPRGPLQIFCTHLNWRFDHSHVRQGQVRAICDFVAGITPRSYPPILCGDLNAAPDSDEIRMLTGRAAVPSPKLVFHDAWEMAGDGGPGLTWSNDNPYAALDLEPARRIDYVLTGWPKQGGAGHVLRTRVEGVWAVDGIDPSDHYAVLAELRY